jgi:NitT/TauT family transport system permease protein
MEALRPAEVGRNERWRLAGLYRTAAPAAFVLANALVALVFVTGWHLVSATVKSDFVPGPLAVWRALITVLVDGDVTGLGLIRHSIVSIGRVLNGFALSCALAIPLGILLGLKPAIYRSSRVVLEPLRFIPPIAWVPIAILLLRGDARYLFIISLGIFFPMLVATMAGVVRTDPIHLDVAKTLGLRPMQRIWKIVLPSALPEIVSGMRIGLGAGWMCIVAAEMIGGELEGLGRMMLNHAELLRVDIIVVGMLTVGAIGFVMNEVFIAVEHRVFRWRRAVEL